MVATAVDLSNLPPLVTPPGTLITVHQSAVLGHPLTRPSTSELAQVISYEAYAPPPQPLPAPTEETAPSLAHRKKATCWHLRVHTEVRRVTARANRYLQYL